MAENTSSTNPTERGHSENMALLMTQVLQEVKDHGKRLQQLQAEQNREKPGAEPGSSGDIDQGAGASRKLRKARITSKVPDRCRDDTRKIYKALVQGDNNFRGFDLNETVDSPHNQQVLQTLRSEVIKDNGGEDKCPFTPREIRDAAKRYYRSLKDDNVRRGKGRLEEHRRKMRKAQRITQKINRRSRALNKCNKDTWEERNLRRAAEILDKNYMSSESSGDERQDPPRLVVKRLPWESKSLKRLKKDLDKVCPQKGTTRERNGQLSDRPVPNGAPTWVIRADWNPEDVDESNSSLNGSLTE